MAFREYRNSCKKSVTHEFHIERFAYDVFAYMLRICNFPEEKIPISSLKENVYEDSFIMNVGLSALPISLYMRDEWRFTFDLMSGESQIPTIQEIQNYLESYIIYSGELEEEDTLSKIQFSLALFNECILFLDFKGIDAFFDSLPKLWSNMCKELIARDEDFDQTLESSLTMCPDVSESWITNFIRNFAIPYGSSDDVSDRFSLLTLECHGEDNLFSGEPSTETGADVVPERTVVVPFEIEEGDTVTIFPEGSNSEVSFIPFGCDQPIPQSLLQTPQGNSYTETRAPSRHRNGLNYVLQLSIKRKKRGRSDKLEVEDAFGRINLEKENISPENRDTKRRRRTSGKDSLE